MTETEAKVVLSDEVKEPAKDASTQGRRGASFFGASFNFIKGMMGAGILSLPHAMTGPGLWPSVISGLLCLVVCYLSMTVLVKAKHEANKNITGDKYEGPVVSYKDVANAAFGTPGKWTLIVLTIIQQTCFASGWVIIMGSTLSSLINAHAEVIPRPAIVAILFVPLMCLSFIRYIKSLAPFSFFGVIVYLFGIIMMSYIYSVPEIDMEHYDIANVSNWAKAPLFMSTMTYTMEGIIGVFPNESSLKNPRQGHGMVAFAEFFLGINGIVYAAIAFVGGYGFGDTIILSFPSDSIVIYIVKIALVFALIMTHPLGINYCTEPIEEILFPETPVAEKTPLLSGINANPDEMVSTDTPKTPLQKFWQSKGRYVIRTGFVLVTVLIGMFIENFSIFSNFVGSISLSFVGFLLPPVLLIKLKKDRKLYHWVYCIAMFCYGIFYMIIGTYVAVQNVKNLNKESSESAFVFSSSTDDSNY